ncbi:MAG: permease-like cell division protein FtsX, partial [Candidatus Magasanikbacteria bacterium]|nr:permease-like cell division protein FtsX [Candidatus Magasanikbacteria bacterium]
MFIAWWRIFKFSLLDLVRNASLATMTVIVLSLLLISVNTLLGIRVLTAAAVTSVKEKIDLSVYLKPETTNDLVTKLTADIKSIPAVKSVNQISADEALQNFKNQYQDRPEIIAALNEVGANPLGPALVVKTDDPTQYSQVITILNKEEYVTLIEDKTFADTAVAIDTLHRVTGSIEKALWGVTAVFGFIAIVIIFTTIRVAIYTERIEIAVKKLVGASNWFIRGPYL